MRRRRLFFGSLMGLVAGNLALMAGTASQAVIPNLPPAPAFAVSTVPPNGDLNPYGVAFVPEGFPQGALNPGDVLVSNFNNSANLQGTGTTIVRIDPSGQQSLFFQGRPGLGLTTALGVLKAGFVLVGTVPTTTASAACTEGPSGHEGGVARGALLILDRQGHLIDTLQNGRFLDGPWDLTVQDQGATAQVFVSNVLSGTVTRLDLEVDATKGDLKVRNTTQIASGYARRCDPNALVVGPTGLALDPATDVLYVASTGDNAIYAVPDASSTNADQGTGTIFVSDAHLHGPLALVRAPNGDLLTAQGDAVNPDPTQPSEIVEYGPTGQFVAEFSVDGASGAAFGLALDSSAQDLRLAAVDDTTNTLDIWIIPEQSH